VIFDFDTVAVTGELEVFSFAASEFASCVAVFWFAERL
jgi:hypothetical protein